MLTTALCFFYLSVRQQQMAKPKPVPARPAPNADPLLRAPEDQQPEALAQAEVAEAADLERPNYAATATTLGNPDEGYKLQVTFTSRGAGVEHAELVERTKNGKLRFRALEHDGGYLGYLGLTETTSGLRIRTIPAGSPAAKAQKIAGGLQVGDVITELNGQSVMTVSGLEQILSRTKAGQQAELVIERSGTEGPQRLTASVTLSEAPLDVLRMAAGDSETVQGNLQRPSLLTTLGSLGGTQIPLGAYALPALQETLDMEWQTLPLEVQGGQGVEFRLPLDSFLATTGRPSQLDLVKRYRLYPVGVDSDGYLLDLETVIVNRNEKEVSLSFRQEGLSGLTLEGWWYTVKISPHMFAGAGQRDVIYQTDATGQLIATTRSVVDTARKTEADMLAQRGQVSPQTPVGLPTILFSESEPIETRSLGYIGLDGAYFSAALLPHPEDPTGLHDLRTAAAFAVAHSPESIDKSKLQATNTSFWLETQEQTVPAGGELARRYQVFIGPKAPETLAAHGLDLAIEYGWFPWVAKPLGAILHFFHFLVGNYGLAIVMLTVVVRGAMFPLGRKAAINAQKMQELQPELKRINELYKDNMEKRAKAMQEVYAKHNFKPLAGCLPMFIQLPIFIGLYRCLSVDISLRQAPLIPGVDWASNLAAPDQLINWSSWMPEFIAGRGTGWLGPYFNILPMVTVGLFLLQQKMLMPKATDEQTRMTQNMMQIMTVFMGVLFFKVPSGLCIYFITSSAWSLVERQLVKRMMPAPKKTDSEASALSNTGVADSKSKEPTRTNPKDRRKGQDPAQSKPASRFQEMMKLLEKPAVKSTTQRGTRKDKKRR
jgi:YidC/Oxa1 family membrane protein insertase